VTISNIAAFGVHAQPEPCAICLLDTLQSIDQKDGDVPVDVEIGGQALLTLSL
jgi:hypothetical protein